MGLKEKMMDDMMKKMSSEERKEMMDNMMESFFSNMDDKEKQDMMNGMMDKFFSGISEEEKNKMMSAMMPKIMGGGGSPMMNMMSMMMGGKGPMSGMTDRTKTGKTDNEASQEMPWDMCRKMMNNMTRSADLAIMATPEIKALFEEWITQIEEEIMNFIDSADSIDADKIADKFKLSKESITFILNRLAQKGKINFKK